MEKQVFELGDMELVKGEPFTFRKFNFEWVEPVAPEPKTPKVQGHWRWPAGTSNRDQFCIRVFPPGKDDHWVIDSYPTLGVGLDFQVCAHDGSEEDKAVLVTVFEHKLSKVGSAIGIGMNF